MMRNHDACEENWDILNDYIDGRLAGRRRAAVETHLISCEQCRRTLAEIEGLRRLVSEADVADASTGFWAKCFESISTMPPLRRKSAVRRAWKPAIAAAASLAAAAVILSIGPVPFRQEDEIPHYEYVMEHVGFVAAQPLGMSSHHVLLSAQGAENVGHSEDADSVEVLDDAAGADAR